jgi:TPR repeat protein
MTDGHSDGCTDPSAPTQTEASVPTPATEKPLMRFCNSKYGTWVGVALIPICICAEISFYMWRLNKAVSLYGQKRYVEAAPYFQNEAESGNTQSMTTLGSMYEEGLGVSKSEEKAAALYLKAVNEEDRPSSQAMVNLAWMYLDGLGGLHKDEQRALELCRRAADADNENGMILLEYIYEQGLGGLPKDPAAALDWYKKSAARGNGFAATRGKELQQQR